MAKLRGPAYKVPRVPAPDLGFTAEKAADLEVWIMQLSHRWQVPQTQLELLRSDLYRLVTWVVDGEYPKDPPIASKEGET
jgi:hypothetical protein